MRQLNTQWTKNLKDPEAKKNFEQLLRNSTTVATRLCDLLKEMKIENSVHDYDSASWAYKQADQNGYNRALRDILALFNYMEK